jgi:hypothetical protein
VNQPEHQAGQHQGSTLREPATDAGLDYTSEQHFFADARNGSQAAELQHRASSYQRSDLLGNEIHQIANRSDTRSEHPCQHEQ